VNQDLVRHVWPRAQGRCEWWQAVGTWTVPEATSPTFSVAPASGAGFNQLFSFAISDPLGPPATLNILINGSLASQYACMLAYSRSSNQMWMVADDSNSWLPPVTVGTADTLENSQCSVDVSKVTVVQGSLPVTLNAPWCSKRDFGGPKTVYMPIPSVWWQTVGAWTVP
jgi:hypothetical protein